MYVLKSFSFWGLRPSDSLPKLCPWTQLGDVRSPAKIYQIPHWIVINYQHCRHRIRWLCPFSASLHWTYAQTCYCSGSRPCFLCMCSNLVVFCHIHTHNWSAQAYTVDKRNVQQGLTSNLQSSYKLKFLGHITTTTDVARSVLCVSVLGTRVRCAKTDEPIEMPLGGRLTHVDPRNHVSRLDESIHSREN